MPRNLLIYMDINLQKNILPLFHYALNPNGFLFLGNSETVGEFGDLFAVLDRKYKLYQRKLDIHGVHRASYGNFLPPVKGDRPGNVASFRKVCTAQKTVAARHNRANAPTAY